MAQVLHGCMHASSVHKITVVRQRDSERDIATTSTARDGANHKRCAKTHAERNIAVAAGYIGEHSRHGGKRNNAIEHLVRYFNEVCCQSNVVRCSKGLKGETAINRLPILKSARGANERTREQEIQIAQVDTLISCDQFCCLLLDEHISHGLRGPRLVSCGTLSSAHEKAPRNSLSPRKGLWDNPRVS